MLKRLIIVIALLVVVIGGIFGIKSVQFRKMQAQLALPQPPATIASTTVTEQQWQPNLKAVGSLVAVDGIDVTTEVAGLVKEVLFEANRRVAKGDVLVKLDDSLDRAVLEGAKASARLARVQLQRNAELLPKKAVSRSQYDEAKAAYDVAVAKVAQEEVTVAKKTIRAPFGGVLGFSTVDPGDYLSPGARIVSLRALDPIYVDYSLPERDFPALKAGMKVELTSVAYPGKVFGGEITAIEPGIDQGTRSVHVRGTLPNPDGALRPGMFVEVRTLKPQSERVLTVPFTAISYNTYGNYVYVIAKGQGGKLIAKRRQVETGAQRAGRVQVTQGLKAGEEVVRAGLVKLRDGQPVTIDNSVKLDDAKVPGE